MFSGMGMVSFMPLVLPQILVACSLCFLEGWKDRLDHGGPLEY